MALIKSNSSSTSTSFPTAEPIPVTLTLVCRACNNQQEIQRYWPALNNVLYKSLLEAKDVTFNTCANRNCTKSTHDAVNFRVRHILDIIEYQGDTLPGVITIHDMTFYPMQTLTDYGRLYKRFYIQQEYEVESYEKFKQEMKKRYNLGDNNSCNNKHKQPHSQSQLPLARSS
jgi:hypothetical protein